MGSNDKHPAEKQAGDKNGNRSTPNETGNWGSSDSDGQHEDEAGNTSGPATNPNSTNGNTKGDPTR